LSIHPLFIKGEDFGICILVIFNDNEVRVFNLTESSSVALDLGNIFEVKDIKKKYRDTLII
jgi:hypothetical protein